MFEELLTQEKAVKRCKEALSELGVEVEPAGPDDEPSPEITSWREQLFAHRLYANALRSIGDGIALPRPILLRSNPSMVRFYQ